MKVLIIDKNLESKSKYNMCTHDIYWYWMDNKCNIGYLRAVTEMEALDRLREAFEEVGTIKWITSTEFDKLKNECDKSDENENEIINDFIGTFDINTVNDKIKLYQNTNKIIFSFLNIIKLTDNTKITTVLDREKVISIFTITFITNHVLYITKVIDFSGNDISINIETKYCEENTNDLTQIINQVNIRNLGIYPGNVVIEKFFNVFDLYIKSQIFEIKKQNRTNQKQN